MDGTYTLEACTISKGCHILIGDTPCQVSKVQYTEGEPDKYGCIFDANDIFSWEKHTLECRATDLITCPYVCDHFYRIVWITNEGKVMLHKRKDPLYLPTTLLEPRQREGDVTPTIGFVARNQKKLQDGKQLLLNVKSAMGKEHILATDKHIIVSSLLLPKPYTPMAELERLFWGANLFWKGRIGYLFGVKSGMISSMDFHRTSYFRKQ